MKIADLFVDLGVKGSEVTVKSLTNVKEGMGEIRTTSLAAKAAIVGVVYGLQRMMAESGNVGTGLQQFANSTGMSTDALQRWQYALRQSGIEASEVEATVRHIQKAMTTLRMEGGDNRGFGIFAQATNLDTSRLDDAFYMLEKAKEFAKMTQGKEGEGNYFLQSLIPNDKIIGAMRAGIMDVDKVAKGVIMSEGMIKSLEKSKVAWMNLGANVEMAFAKFTAQHGGRIVSDLTKLTTAVLKLADALLKLADKYAIFDKISETMKVTAAFLGGEEEGYMMSKVAPEKREGLRKLLRENEEASKKLNWVGSRNHWADFTGALKSSVSNIINQNININGNPNDPSTVSKAARRGALDGIKEANSQIPTTQGN